MPALPCLTPHGCTTTCDRLACGVNHKFFLSEMSSLILEKAKALHYPSSLLLNNHY